MKLILIRHGQSVANAASIIQGQQEFPLSKQGKKEASLIGEWLAGERIDALYSSDLSRAYDTALEIAKYHALDVIPLQQLRECSLGPFEGLTNDDITEQYPEYDRIDWLSANIPGVEQVADLEERATQLIDYLLQQHEQDTVVAVSHGGFISSLVMKCLNIPWPGRRVFAIKNTSITTLLLAKSKPSIVLGINETPHLQLAEYRLNRSRQSG